MTGSMEKGVRESGIKGEASDDSIGEPRNALVPAWPQIPVEYSHVRGSRPDPPAAHNTGGLTDPFRHYSLHLILFCALADKEVVDAIRDSWTRFKETRGTRVLSGMPDHPIQESDQYPRHIMAIRSPLCHENLGSHVPRLPFWERSVPSTMW